MEKIRFGAYIPPKMKEDLDTLSQRSKIKISSLVEEAIGDLFKKTEYQKFLAEETKGIANVSLKQGWLCLSNDTKKTYLKTFPLLSGEKVTLTIDNSLDWPISLQAYDLENRLNLNSWLDIRSETIRFFRSFEETLTYMEKQLSENNFKNLKAFIESISTTQNNNGGE